MQTLIVGKKPKTLLAVIGEKRCEPLFAFRERPRWTDALERRRIIAIGSTAETWGIPLSPPLFWTPVGEAVVAVVPSPRSAWMRDPKNRKRVREFVRASTVMP